MRSASTYGCLILSLCLIQNVKSDFGVFFNNIPREISNALSSTWATIVEAIKEPVRIKRLGRGGKRKTSTSTTMSTMTTTTSAIATVVQLDILKYFGFYPSIKLLRVPVLITPEWKTINDWKNMQIPRFVRTKVIGKELSQIAENSIINEKNIGPAIRVPAKLDDEQNYGVLFFI